MSGQVIKPLNNTHAAELIYSSERMFIKFDRNYLKQEKITFNHGKKVNIYIVYKIIKTNPISNSYPIVQNCFVWVNWIY